MQPFALVVATKVRLGAANLLELLDRNLALVDVQLLLLARVGAATVLAVAVDGDANRQTVLRMTGAVLHLVVGVTQVVRR
jgi:hypothetical protein